MDKLPVIKKILELLTERRISAKELSLIIEKNASYISDIKTKNVTPSGDVLSKIADYFGVSTDYLLGKKTPTKAVRLNVLGRIPAGMPIEAVEDVLDWEEIPEKWLEGGNEFFALKVSGDSMFPKYIDKDVIICRKQPDCDSGQDAVIFVNSYDATLKKVIKKENGIILQPINERYEPHFYNLQDIENLPIKMLGIVIEIRRKV